MFGGKNLGNIFGVNLGRCDDELHIPLWAVLDGCKLPNHGCLTEKAEPQPTRDVNRDGGTDRADGELLGDWSLILNVKINYG